MSRLTNQLTVVIGGLRGPGGGVTSDLEALEERVIEKAEEAAASAGEAHEVATELQDILTFQGSLISAGSKVNDLLFAFTATDTAGRVRRLGGIRTSDGALAPTRFAMVAGNSNGGLTMVSDPQGTLTVSLGTERGKLPIGTGGLLIDNANPRYTLVSTITDANGRVRKASGITVEGDAGSGGGILEVAERYAAQKLSETSSAIGDIKGVGIGGLLGARVPPYQLVINIIGNSWNDNPDFWVQRFTRRIRELLGDAGAGFVAATRLGTAAEQTNGASADPAVVGTERTGSWTISDASNGGNVPGPMVEQATSATVGDKVRYTQLSGATSSVYLFALNNGATVAVSKNGGAATNVPLSAVATNLGQSLAVGDYIEIAVVSGTVTLYGADFRRNQTGVRVNKLGNSSSTWVHWLNADSAAWQAGITGLGGDLMIMLESINGANSWGAEQEVTYTQQMVARVRAALPLTDILLISPPVTLATPVYSLAARATALRTYAQADGKMAHLDLQPAFGSPGTYGEDSHQYFRAADTNHPWTKGRALLADRIFRMIFD